LHILLQNAEFFIKYLILIKDWKKEIACKKNDNLVSQISNKPKHQVKAWDFLISF
jgi:hypothetical protein